MDEDQECEVEKEARLASVEQITWPVEGGPMKSICQQSGGSPIGASIATCFSVPADELLLFVNVTSPNDACAAVVKLL